MSSIGNGLKAISDQSILNDAIEGERKRGKIFSKIDGRGTSIFYYLDAILSIVAGLLYDINPYIPMTAAAIGGMTAIVLSLRFEETENTKKGNVRKYTKDIKNTIKFSIKSSRLKSLLLFSGLMWGIICLMNSYQTSLLNDFEISALNIGIIFAGLKLLTAIASKRQVKFNEKYKNKSLEHMGYSYTVAVLIAGLICIIENANIFLVLGIVICAFGVMQYNVGTYNVLIKRYLGNFSTPELTQNIYAVNELFSNFMRLIVEMLGSMLLKATTTSNAIAVVECISVIAIMFTLQYMKPRVGLKPEEYKKEDINLKIN